MFSQPQGTLAAAMCEMGYGTRALLAVVGTQEVGLAGQW